MRPGGSAVAGWLVLALLAALVVPAAHAADPVAVLTEIRPGRGEVRVRRAGETDWTVPRALQALRPGDQVRVTADGRATLASTGGGTQAVTAATSPFTVEAPRGVSGTDRARGLVAGVAQFLLGQQKAPTYQSLSVRAGGSVPVRILAPRDTRLLPGPVVFEWTGPPRAEYRVRVVGAQGEVVWEHAGLPRRPLAYPTSAPALAPGARYGWVVELPGQPAQRSEFEVVPAADAARIRGALDELVLGAAAGTSGSARILLRAGLLFQEGLYADARRELAAAVAADPDEPTLRLLLGYVYDRTGLTELAAQEFDEAEYLASPKP
jgi:hypothetical protein